MTSSNLGHSWLTHKTGRVRRGEESRGEERERASMWSQEMIIWKN